MIIVSHRVVGRISKMRYVRFVAQRLWCMVSKCKCKPPLPSFHPQVICLQKCKPVPTNPKQVDEGPIQTINPTTLKS